MTRMKSKWLILFLVLGLVMVACGGSDTAEEVVEVAEEPAEELESPATTAAPTTTAGPTASIGMVYDLVVEETFHLMTWHMLAWKELSMS